MPPPPPLCSTLPPSSLSSCSISIHYITTVNREMDSCKISQALKLSVIVALLIITPFLSSSLRSTYLYFIFNLLVIALGLESGLLSSSASTPSNDAAPITSSKATDADAVTCSTSDENKQGPEIMNKSIASVPAPLFFIGGGGGEDTDDDNEEEIEEAEEKEEVVGVLSGQELFNRAESFIGNFYKQLKMQQEAESWNRLHDFF